MNLKLFVTPCSLFLAVTLFFAACSKEGPAGPAGAQGPAGPTGPTGAQGPKGDTGTANVIYSNWLDVVYKPDTVQEGTVIDTLGFFADITAAKLTNTILTNGEIKVFLNLGTAATPVIVPLPYFDVYTFISITPTYLEQRISLYSNIDASTFTQAGAKRLQYRYILIPGGTPAGGRMAKINWNNYEEVKAYLGLKD